MQNRHKHQSRYEYGIDLNFLAIEQPLPDCIVYRRPPESEQERRPRDDLLAYRLPDDPSGRNWTRYWISLHPLQGFEEYRVSARENHHLTTRILLWSLEATAERLYPSTEFYTDHRHFINEVAFVQRKYAEGQELFLVQPYYLRVSKTFGYLVDFHFQLREGTKFSKRIQQLSLSLDKRYRRNLDYYTDRLAKINEFLKHRHQLFENLSLPNECGVVRLSNRFTTLPASTLKAKIYVFSNNRESRSQFTGLKSNGPLRDIPGRLTLLFVFREQDRQLARQLARSILGRRTADRSTFPGFRSLFGSDPMIASNPQILQDLSRRSIEDALRRSESELARSSVVVPILILPVDDGGAYVTQKALFSQAEIASQVCTVPVVQDRDTLRWAISNIALQIFCKAGGFPWKVRPSGERSLIVGISQSHKLHRSESGMVEVDRFFSFSVMTDNSGLFQSIEVLSDSDEEGGYIDALKSSLQRIIRRSVESFDNVIVHTSFKLKRREINAIQEVVSAAAEQESSDCRFAVVKINHRARFFGNNPEVNSLVPYEATSVRLGPGEYLLWFEGIFPDKRTVTKAFPGPTHVQIIHPDTPRRIPDDVLLQDLINLSGANWRGFNAKSAPVSVFYCHLVASFIQSFHESKLPLPSVSDIKPWFL